MSRSKRLGGRSNVKELLAGRPMETIVEDVIKAKAMPFAEWHALSPNPPVPLAIPVSWGWQYQETQAGVDAAHTLTRQTWKSREDLRQTIDRDAFAKLSFQGHGDTLRNIPVHLLQVPEDEHKSTVLGADFYEALAADRAGHKQRLWPAMAGISFNATSAID